VSYALRLMVALQCGLLRAGDIASAEVAHDSWCGVHRGEECGCSPEIIVTTTRGRMRVEPDGSVTPVIEQ
jgi:hypothetical protein